MAFYLDSNPNVISSETTEKKDILWFDEDDEDSKVIIKRKDWAVSEGEGISFNIISERPTSQRFRAEFINIRNLGIFHRAEEGILSIHVGKNNVTYISRSKLMLLSNVTSPHIKIEELYHLENAVLSGVFNSSESTFALIQNIPNILLLMKAEDLTVKKIKSSYDAKYENVCMSPRGTFYFCYGKDSSICTIFSGRTGLKISDILVSSGVDCACFSPKEAYLFVSNSNNQILVYETESFEVIAVHEHTGGRRCTSIAFSSDESLLALGSDVGIVSIYSLAEDFSSIKLLFCFENLISAIDCIRFHPSSQVIVFSSSLERNAIRVGHISSGTIYPNWPGDFYTGRISSLEFSKDGDKLVACTLRNEISMFDFKP